MYSCEPSTFFVRELWVRAASCFSSLRELITPPKGKPYGWSGISLSIWGCCVNGVPPVTRKISPRCSFYRVLGSLKGLDRVFGALKLPNSCPTSHCAQTPVTQQHKKDSPNVKNACVYGTSVNIADSCAP